MTDPTTDKDREAMRAMFPPGRPPVVPPDEPLAAALAEWERWPYRASTDREKALGAAIRAYLDAVPVVPVDDEPRNPRRPSLNGSQRPLQTRNACNRMKGLAMSSQLQDYFDEAVGNVARLLYATEHPSRAQIVTVRRVVDLWLKVTAPCLWCAGSGRTADGYPCRVCSGTGFTPVDGTDDVSGDGEDR